MCISLLVQKKTHYKYNERFKAAHFRSIAQRHSKNNPTESRREWILWMMKRAAKKNSNTAKFQLWQPESHPIQLINNKMAPKIRLYPLQPSESRVCYKG